MVVAACLACRRCLNLEFSRNNAVQRNTLDTAASSQMGVDLILKLSEWVRNYECSFPLL